MQPQTSGRHCIDTLAVRQLWLILVCESTGSADFPLFCPLLWFDWFTTDASLPECFQTLCLPCYDKQRKKSIGRLHRKREMKSQFLYTMRFIKHSTYIYICTCFFNIALSQVIHSLIQVESNSFSPISFCPSVSWTILFLQLKSQEINQFESFHPDKHVYYKPIILHN